MSEHAQSKDAPSHRRYGNRGGYTGEQVDIAALLRDVTHAGRRHGWLIESLPVVTGLEILTLSRRVEDADRRIYLSSGIHGDEPAGPMALLQLIEENRWPERTDLWVVPCLNPTGFPLSRRENAAGRDLNRDYRHLQAEEVRAHVRWLERQPSFDCTLCLHEDWEANGFYVYELNPDGQRSHAEAMLRMVSRVCPIDNAQTIDGRTAREGIIRPDFDPVERPLWPEAFYLVEKKTRHSYTLEAPSDFAMSVRVAALVTGVRAVVEDVR
jgi:murein peptide amidase A